MPLSFAICALDPFGAEVLARVFALDGSLREESTIAWHWLGGDTCPPVGVPWSAGRDSPGFPIRPPSWQRISQDYDRAARFGEAKDLASIAFGKHNRKVQKTAATEQDAVTWVLFVGSLANPDSAILAQASFSSLAENPALWQGWRMAGVWALARSTCDLDLEEDLCDASTATSLDDFQEILQRAAASQPDVWYPLFPQFLVGAGPNLVDPPPSRPDSSVQCAMAVLGVLHRQLREPNVDSLFFFRHESDRTAKWARQRFDPSRPFGLFGAAIVSQRRELLIECIAGVMLRKMLEELARQPEPGTQGRPLSDSDDPPALEAYINGLVSDALRSVTSHLARNGCNRDTPVDGLFSPEILVHLLGWEKKISIWKSRIEEVFGWPAIVRLPLEDWDQTLQELEAVTLRFFKTDMEREESSLLHNLENGLRSAITETLDKICDDALYEVNSPAPWKPHLLARRFLERLLQRLKEQNANVSADLVRERRELPDDKTMAEFEPLRHRLARRLKKKVRAIPSPVAVLCRLAAMATGCFLVFQCIDFPYYAAQSDGFVFHAKWIKGLVAAILMGGYLVFRARVVVPRQLRKAYKNWQRHLLDHLIAQSKLAFLAVREHSHQLAYDYADYLLRPELPPETRFHGFTEVRVVPPAGPLAIRIGLAGNATDRRIRRFVHKYHQDLRRGIRAWSLWLRRQADCFNTANRDIVLPLVPSGAAGETKFLELAAEALPELNSDATRRQAVFRKLAGAIPFATEDPGRAQGHMLLRKGTADCSGRWNWSGDFSCVPFPSRQHLETRALCQSVVHTLTRGLKRVCPGIERPLGTWLLNDIYGCRSDWGEVTDIHIPFRSSFVQKTVQQHPLFAPPGSTPHDLTEFWVPQQNLFTQSFVTEMPGILLRDLVADDDPYAGFIAVCRLRLGLNAQSIVAASVDLLSPHCILGLQKVNIVNSNPILPDILCPVFPRG